MRNIERQIKMKKIYVATKARGFLVNLFDSNLKDYQFLYDSNQIFETNSTLKQYISKLVKSKLADWLGVIQRLKVDNKDFDIAFSYNRFLKTSQKYVVYLENPLALVHYSIDRNKYLISRLKLNKFLNDTNLKAIVCLSKACYDTLNHFYSIPEHIKVEQIYPLVHSNSLTSEESIKKKSRKKEIICLYISSNYNLKGGKDILETFKKLNKNGINNIKLKIITQLSSIDQKTKKEINNNPNISLYDFKFSKEELNVFYNESSILLNPSRQDSFSLVVLEAMKSGNTILSTDLYAIPEMVVNGFNGYLISPKYRFFNYDNLPNKEVWNNRENTIYSDYIDENIVNFLYDKITYLNLNRDKLEEMSLNSFNKANNSDFNEEIIKNKWINLFDNI